MTNQKRLALIVLAVTVFLIGLAVAAYGHNEADRKALNKRIKNLSERVATAEATLSASPWEHPERGGLSRLENGADSLVAFLTGGTLIALAAGSLRVLTRGQTN